MDQKIDFFTLNELFLNLGAINSPAELQGMLCGQLSGGKQFAPEQWLEVALQFMDLEDIVPSEEQAADIQALYQDTVKLLDDVNFSFQPMLPDEGATLVRKTQELGVWCQGYLHGLGASGLSGESQLTPDIADALRDLAQISQVSVEDDDDLDENEAYWLELVEYVKVAVLTVYTELSNSDKGADNNTDNNSDTNKLVH